MPPETNSPTPAHCALFRFYAELNDFLARTRRGREIEYRFNAHPAIKDSVEALGVPHTEVDLILVHGVAVDFTYRLRHGDRVSVYPVFESFDITPLPRPRPFPLRVSRFVVDSNLGQLAVYLRLLGFDTLYDNHWEDAELAAISQAQKRILLTRDQGVLKRECVTHGYYPRHAQPEVQIREVLRRFDLYRAIRPFHRCLRCNGQILEVSKTEVTDLLPPRVRAQHSRFYRCGNCRRVYWEGSHYQRMRRWVGELLAEQDGGNAGVSAREMEIMRETESKDGQDR